LTHFAVPEHKWNMSNFKLTRAVADPFDIGLSEREASSYSLQSALLSLDNGQTCFEREVSQSIAQKMGRPPRGIFVPTVLRPQASGLDSKSDAAGNYTVAQLVPDLLDGLRQQTRLVQLGAEFVNLKSDALYPTVDSATQAYWTSENSGADVTETTPVFGAKGIAAHTLQSTCSISRQLLIQNSVSLERRLRLDLMRSHAIALDQAGIQGSGNSSQPIGLLNVSGINIVSAGQNGATATYAHICSLEAALGNAHADNPECGFLTTPDQRSKLRQVWVNGTNSAPVWGENGLLGYTSLVSKGVPSNLSKGSSNGTLSAIICGLWSQMTIASFGALDIVVDVFTAKRTGMIQISVFSMADVLVRQPQAFAAIVDAV
jgi:HK97 family phage major capsid protein